MVQKKLEKNFTTKQKAKELTHGKNNEKHIEFYTQRSNKVDQGTTTHAPIYSSHSI